MRGAPQHPVGSDLGCRHLLARIDASYQLALFVSLGRLWVWVPRRSSVAATRTFGATAPTARMRLWRSRSSTWPSSA